MNSKTNQRSAVRRENSSPLKFFQPVRRLNFGFQPFPRPAVALPVKGGR